jgi:hypothetical protein
VSAASIEHAETFQSIGKMIQDLFHSDNAKVNAALDALNPDFMKVKMKSERFVRAGGCLALVQLLKKCLDKAIASIPACDHVADLTDHAELSTLRMTLSVIIHLTFNHHESRDGIAARLVVRKQLSR